MLPLGLARPFTQVGFGTHAWVATGEIPFAVVVVVVTCALATETKASATTAASRKKEVSRAMLEAKGRSGPVTGRWMEETARYNERERQEI